MSTQSQDIRPFTVTVSQESLDDLHDRLDIRGFYRGLAKS
jgi:hypothetical protein